MTEPTEQEPLNLVEEIELNFISSKTEEYKAQGLPEDEAKDMAASDWAEKKRKIETENGDVWNEVTKKIGLPDFLDDQIRRALGVYKKTFEEAEKAKVKEDPTYIPRTIDFKLYMKSDRHPNSAIGRKGQPRLIAGAHLILEYAINGLWKVWRDKGLNFTHVQQMKEIHVWKLHLYEAMLQDLMGWGVTYCLAADAWNEKVAANGNK